MCGIVAVLSRPPSRRPPAAPEIRRLLGGKGDECAPVCRRPRSGSPDRRG